MPLDTYAALQTSILSWLARPGDPLVSPSIPDIIELFEREATRRLKVGGAEKRVSLTALSAAVALPADFGELRLATSGGVILTYVTPMQLPDGGGPPAHYTIIGNEMRLGPSPSGGCTVEIVYQSGVPPLSDTNTTNWLLTAHPDCYLFGSLVEAESFIGSDERVPLWAQRREAAFASIETADRKARWGGAPLSIRAEGVSGGNGTAAGDWTSAPPVPIPIAAIVAGDGLTGGGTEGIVTVALSTPVTIGRGGTGATTAAAALANLGGAPLASPALSGNPTAPTPAPGDADTSIATTAFVAASYAPLASPVLSGNPTAPTPAPGDNDTSVATTAFVGAALSAQALAGDVTGPTNNTAVVRLQGRPVAATAPTSLQVLQWSGTNWAPATIAAGGTLTGVTAGTGITVSGAAPSPTVALTVPVTVANGGTGSTTAGAALTALGAAASPVSVAQGGTAKTSWTTGSVAFAASATALGEDNANLFWDDTNNRLGVGTAAPDARVTVSANTAALPALPAATVLHIGGTDATTNRSYFDAFAAGSAINFRRANGTAATRSALALDDQIGVVNALGYGASAYGTVTGAVSFNAAQAWTASAQGTYINFSTTPNNATAPAEAMRIAHNGNVGIGVTGPAARLVVATAGAMTTLAVQGGTAAGDTLSSFSSGPAGADSTTVMALFLNGTNSNVSGSITRTGTNNLAFNTASDERLKTDICQSERGLDALMAIRVSDYSMGETRAQGLLAQDVAKVYPEAVHVGGDDPDLQPWMIDYGRLTPLLIKALQEAMARIEALEGKPA